MSADHQHSVTGIGSLPWMRLSALALLLCLAVAAPAVFRSDGSAAVADAGGNAADRMAAGRDVFRYDTFEAVLDKGYHSKQTLLDLNEMDIRS